MTVRSRYFTLVASGPTVERAVLFSDAVFAIALTLLVIEIHVPQVPPAELGQALAHLLPDYLAFALSFFVIGGIWMSHHRKFRTIERHDQTLLRLNLVMLLFVASLPLPTAVLAGYGDTVTAVVLYSGSIAAIGAMMSVIWWFAYRRGLTSVAVDRELFRYMLGQSLVIPVMFALSIPVALLAGAHAAQAVWVLSLPMYLVLGRVAGRGLPTQGARR